MKKTKKNIDIEQIFEVTSRIKEVKPSIDFKENTLQRLFQSKDEYLFSWFTPKIQAASIVLFLFLNVGAIWYTSENNYQNKVADFAKAFNMNDNSENLNY